MSKQAVLLVGGRGQRLRPYTVVLPKPLMPIGEFPILEVVVRQLARHGFDDLIFAVNHQANLINAFFGDGSAWNVAIRYSREDTPLGTVGPLRLIDGLEDNFLLLNGDVLTDLNFSQFLDWHVNRENEFSIAATRRFQSIDFGVLRVDNDGTESCLTDFEEKPTNQYLVSMGVYAMRKSVVGAIPNNNPFGFDELMMQRLRRHEPVSVFRHDGYWLDIGRPDDYLKAIDDFESMREKLFDF